MENKYKFDYPDIGNSVQYIVGSVSFNILKRQFELELYQGQGHTVSSMVTGKADTQTIY